VSSSALTFAAGASLDINLRDSADHGCLRVINHNQNDVFISSDITVKITPGAELNLIFLPGFKANAGDDIVILRNTGANKINGEFVGLKEGAKIKLGHASGTLTYEYDADNDEKYNDIAIVNVRLSGTLLFLK